MTIQDMHRLAAETGVSLPSIRKWLADPASVQRAIAYAITAGMKRLRMAPVSGATDAAAG